MAIGKTDEELLRAFAAGKRAALGTLAERYERPLLGLMSGMLGRSDAELACDIVQETWVRVIRHAAQFDGRSRFKTWVYRIAINQCRSALASKPANEVPSNPDANTESQSSPTANAENNEYVDRVRAAVAALPPDKRGVVLLCYHNGMRHDEAAEVLEIPVGTLKSRLHAALAELRERLTPELKP